MWLCEYVRWWACHSLQCKWEYMTVMIKSPLSIRGSAIHFTFWWESIHFPSTALKGNGIRTVSNVERKLNCQLFTLCGRHTHSLDTGTEYATSRCTPSLIYTVQWVHSLTHSHTFLTFCAKLHFQHSVRGEEVQNGYTTKKRCRMDTCLCAQISILWIY